MSNDLTEAERAAAAVLLYEEGSEWAEGTERHEELAQQIVAAVRPIIEAEITQHPDVNNMDRGFGNCPHCLSPRVAHCHECLGNIERDSAHAEGWRMDHLGGFGCIAVCPGCRNEDT